MKWSKVQAGIKHTEFFNRIVIVKKKSDRTRAKQGSALGSKILGLGLGLILQAFGIRIWIHFSSMEAPFNTTHFIIKF